MDKKNQNMEQMKKLFIFTTLAATMAGCFLPSEMQLQVAPMGEEVPETTSRYMYALPQTVLKVEVTYQEMRHVPGPFREYAEKYLGIKEVINKNFSRWQILDVEVSPHREMDPAMVFMVNVLEGEFNNAIMDPFLEKGIIMNGSELVQEEVKSPALGSNVIRDYVRYKDLGIESNFAERTETMYKTIVTDTSFVEVPVDRTIMEQKSPAMKAKEAAGFLLELRTRRLELLTGGYDGFPQGEAMAATLDKLDELEASYLSLFTGKTLGKTATIAWFIVPESGRSGSSYKLGLFSEMLGFVPEDLQEGEPLKVIIEPLGKTGSMGAYYSGTTDEPVNNELWYRLPDVVELKVTWRNEELSKQRISVYQSGALISSPVRNP
ncbi:MAG: DUF4831 family protein [Bacteroidota bacterium]